MHSFNNFSSFEKPIEKKAKQQAKNKGGGGNILSTCYVLDQKLTRTSSGEDGDRG